MRDGGPDGEKRVVNSREHLDVLLHGERVGKLWKTRESLLFAYEQGYLDRSDATALSARLPLKAGPSAEGEAGKWFDGLLPEGERRERIARQARSASMSTYSMLRAIGAECAGAVEVRTPGELRHADKEPASTEEIERYIRKMDRFPLRSGEGRLALSLAGAQAKFVLVKEDDGWSWPIGGYVSTHIVKPEQERFPGLAANEHACMEIARRAGLRAARTTTERFGRYRTLVVERFDRNGDGGRIHQEDFAQALGTHEKYQRDGGPSLKECFTRSGAGGWELWDQVMFAWLIGDEDKHAKNLSIQYPTGGARRLTPVYDAVCTLAYPKLERGMAMRIGRAWHIREVDAGAIWNEASKCGLPPDEALERLRALAGRVRDAVEGMRGSSWSLEALERAGIDARLEASCEWAKR